MSEMNNLNRQEQQRINLVNPEECVRTVTVQGPLTPDDVASLLGVCRKTAKTIMMELPHMQVSPDKYGANKQVRITVKTFNDFLSGNIKRNRMRRAG